MFASAPYFHWSMHDRGLNRVSGKIIEQYPYQIDGDGAQRYFGDEQIFPNFL